MLLRWVLFLSVVLCVCCFKAKRCGDLTCLKGCTLLAVNSCESVGSGTLEASSTTGPLSRSSRFHDRILFASSFVSSATAKGTETESGSISSSLSLSLSGDGSSSSSYPRPLTVIIDGDNVRGKSAFRLSKEMLVDGVAKYLSSDEVRRSGLSIHCAVVFDHGSRHQAFQIAPADLPLTHLNLKKKEGDNTLDESESKRFEFDNSIGSGSLAVVFAGPSRTADDVIARDTSWLENWGFKHVKHVESLRSQNRQNSDNSGNRNSIQGSTSRAPYPRVVVVTQDNGLRKRCKPKSSRLTKAERKTKDKESARRALRNEPDLDFTSDLCVISSKMLADLLLSMYSESDVPLSCELVDKELTQKKADLKQEVELSRKLGALLDLLKTSSSFPSSRKCSPKLQTQAHLLSQKLESIRANNNNNRKVGENEVGVLGVGKEEGEDLVKRGSLFLRQLRPDQNEDTWERVLHAENLRSSLVNATNITNVIKVIKEKNSCNDNDKETTLTGAHDILRAYVSRINTKFRDEQEMSLV